MGKGGGEGKAGGEVEREEGGEGVRWSGRGVRVRGRRGERGGEEERQRK
jgi:hypothetical protein